MRQLLDSFEDNPTFIEIRAAGSILHDFYCGIEKIFEKIAVLIDKTIPRGENWHSELLLQMGKSIKNKREKVISEDLLQTLKEYLTFRHLFRHIYGFKLKWEKFEALCINLETFFKKFKTELANFFEFTKDLEKV